MVSSDFGIDIAKGKTIMSFMERIRVYFDATEALRYALKQAALRHGKTVSSLIEEILAEHIGKKALTEAGRIVEEQNRQKAEFQKAISK